MEPGGLVVTTNDDGWLELKNNRVVSLLEMARISSVSVRLARLVRRQPARVAVALAVLVAVVALVVAAWRWLREAYTSRKPTRKPNKKATAKPTRKPTRKPSKPTQKAQTSMRRQLLSSAAVPWRTGNATWYNSFPECCDNPKADQTECVKNNGCTWKGQFADDTKLSLSEVQQRNIVAFYVPPNSRNRREWDAKFKGRWIRIKSGTKTMDVEVKDTCDDDDCPETKCCTTNANAFGHGYLLDLEHFTSKRMFGSPKNAQVQFVFITGPGGSPVPWSQVGL